MNADRCVCAGHDICLGVPGESDACGACLELDLEERCLMDVRPDCYAVQVNQPAPY